MYGTVQLIVLYYQKKFLGSVIPRKIPVTKISTGISSVDVQFVLTKTSIHKISEVSKSQVKPP